MDLRPIQKHLQQIPCPVHGELPCISIWGDRLEIRCCCDAFRCELLRQSKSLMYHALGDEIAKDLRRIMRGKG